MLFLWTKVDEILGHRARPFVVSNARPRLSITCFVPKIFAVKVATSYKNVENMSGFWAPIF